MYWFFMNDFLKDADADAERWILARSLPPGLDGVRGARARSPEAWASVALVRSARMGSDDRALTERMRMTDISHFIGLQI
jgi:hypothetical protein